MAEGPLDWCESKLGKCHLCAVADESHATAQRLLRLPAKQKAPVRIPVVWLDIFPTWLASIVVLENKAKHVVSKYYTS